MSIKMFNLIPEYDELAAYDAVSNGATTDYTFGFSYLGQSDWDGTNSSQIKVFTGDTDDTLSETTAWTMPSATTIRFNVAPANGKIIYITRDSDPSTVRVNYQDGSRLTADNSNLAYRHVLYLVQELNDKLESLAQASNPNSGNSTIGFTGNHFTATGTGSSQNITLTGERGLDIYSLLVTDNGAYVDTNNYTVADVAGVSTVTITITNGHTIRIRVLAGGVVASNSPGAGTVGTTQLQSSSVTFPKIDFSGTGTNGQVLFKRAGVATFDNIVADDISDFNATVRGENSIDQLGVAATNLNLNNKKITSLEDPTAAQDASTKNYVDAHISSAITANQDNGRVISGQFTASSSFATVTLGWQFDMLIVWADWGLSSGYRGTGPGGQLSAPTPTLGLQTVYANAYGTTNQAFYLQTNNASVTGNELTLKQNSTGFQHKLFYIGGIFPPSGTLTFNYIAVRNSTAP